MRGKPLKLCFDCSENPQPTRRRKCEIQVHFGRDYMIMHVLLALTFTTKRSTYPKISETHQNTKKKSKHGSKKKSCRQHGYEQKKQCK